jgi:HEAT repeat protein
VSLVNESDIERAIDELGHARKAIQRPAAERLADAARGDATVRSRLVEQLASSEPRRRWGAAYALARLEPAPAEAMPALLDALGSADGDVRWASARLLTRAVQHVPRLIEDVRAIVRASSPLQRKMALYCLRDIGVDAAVDHGALAAALADEDAAVRLAAMSAVAALLPRTTHTGDLLAPLIADVDPGVRRAAAATVGQVGVRTDAVLRALESACASGDAALERVSSQALSRLGATDSVAAPSPPPPRRPE